MPFWPFLIAASGGFAVWGWRIGGGAYRVPLILLATYCLVRLIIWGMHPETHEVAMPILWACSALLIAYAGAPVVAVFFLLSGMTYPAMLLFGFRIEYMGLSPIIAEIFAILGLITLGGGLAGLAGTFSPDPNSSRLYSGFCRVAVYLAPSTILRDKVLGQDRG